MYVSKYNAIIDLHNHPDVAVIHNLFHGRASLVPRAVGDTLRPMIGCETDSKDSVLLDLRARRFLYESKEAEEQEIAELFRLFQAQLRPGNAGRKYELLLSYDCNLRCVYCFQKKLRGGSIRNEPLTDAHLDAIFAAISTIEKRNIDASRPSPEPALLSLVGGEPLLPHARHRAAIARIMRFASDHGYGYSITTNGVGLIDYLDLFEAGDRKPNHVQVTIDGPPRIHDSRRIAIGGGGSFRQISESITAALEAEIRIGVRVNVDLMNIDGVSELGALIRANGWHNRPNFSAYLAPVTDHSAVNQNYRWIKADASIIRRLVELFEEQPELEDLFTMKNFRGFNQVKELSRGGDVAPVFWRCEAVLGQLVFDPKGDLYTCFEAAGQATAKIGRYYPDLEIQEERLDAWSALNTFDNKMCGACRFRFVCASGCPWHIIGQGATECLPIEEELELAWNHFAPVYMDKLYPKKSLAEH